MARASRIDLTRPSNLLIRGLLALLLVVLLFGHGSGQSLGEWVQAGVPADGWRFPLNSLISYGGRLYAGNAAHLHVSADNGNSWTSFARGLGFESEQVKAVGIKSNNNAAIPGLENQQS
jgi:hypothetical protein